ncbi:MAG: prephenate dehydrogenase [Gemmatimonadetes bacterium]|nr:prephenate dehydrogenase [Gemmatimonadota bacterium]
MSSTERPFASVAILGLGVMGGSLARALTSLGDKPRVTGWSPSAEERAQAVAARALDAAPAAWEDAVRGADLIILAAPLAASCAMLAPVARAAPADATLSDVASLKAPLASAAASAGVSARWVGCHPMAGSEASGFAASRPDLYREARVWVVASEEARSRVARVHALWRSIGARPADVEAGSHDRLMSLASHLPQLASNALATVLADSGVRPDQLGPGGRDTTRLAGSSADLWKDLLGYASPGLARGLRDLAAQADRLADLLDRRDIETIAEIMRTTRTWRES